MSKSKKAKRTFPTVDISGDKYKVHFGIIAMDRYHEITGESTDKILADLKKDRSKVRIKDLAKLYYSTLSRIDGKEVLSWEDFYEELDADMSLFNDMTNAVNKQTEEKKA